MGDSNLLATSTSFACVWLLQSTELLRVGPWESELKSFLYKEHFAHWTFSQPS